MPSFPTSEPSVRLSWRISKNSKKEASLIPTWRKSKRCSVPKQLHHKRLEGRGCMKARRDRYLLAPIRRALLLVASLGTILVSISAHASNLAIDDKGNLFVADDRSHSIFKYTPDGTKNTVATGLRMPLGLCFDGKGNLFVSDGAANTARSQRSILKFGPNGRKSTFVSGISSFGMAFDRSGNLFVADNVGQAEKNSIFKFTPDGVKSTFVSGIGNPGDLAFDEAGNLFVVDYPVMAGGGGSILTIDSSGTPRTFASDWMSPDKQWEYKLVDGNSPEIKFPEIVKAGTTQVVLDLDKELKVSSPERLNWAPDSKRFAFTYSSPPHARNTTYATVAFYQLRGDKWIQSRSPV